MDNQKTAAQITREMYPKTANMLEPDYSDIVLTEEETRNAIQYFKMLKSRKIDEDKKRENYLFKKSLAQKPWTYDELKNDVLKRAERLPFQFSLDQDNELVFHILCLYFSNDPRLSEFGAVDGTGKHSPYLHSKGIGIFSDVKGTGKSVLMELFARNKKRPFINIPTRDIAKEFNNHQEAAIKRFSETLYVPESASLFYCQHLGICYEDLGMEREKNSYGNKSDVMYDILFKVYENCKVDMDFSSFHFTSNFNGVQFENRYDDRIRSRMRQMFNFIELPGKDRRK